MGVAGQALAPRVAGPPRDIFTLPLTYTETSGSVPCAPLRDPHNELVDHAACVRPTVADVADHDHREVTELVEQLRQQVGAAVYVTDDGDGLIEHFCSGLDHGSVPGSVDATRSKVRFADVAPAVWAAAGVTCKAHVLEVE